MRDEPRPRDEAKGERTASPAPGAPEAPASSRDAFRDAVPGIAPIAPPRSQRVAPLPPSKVPLAHAAVLGAWREEVAFDVAWSPDGFVEGVRSGASREGLEELRHAATLADATLDLHGVRAADAAARIEAFVRACHRDGVRRLLIIHGKGLHSDRGRAVLGERTVDALTEGRARHLVRAIVTAPASLGGHGAVVVALEDDAHR